MYNDTFTTNKNINNLKLAIISDIHYYYPNFNINIFTKLKNQLTKNKPDYICLIGDIVHEQKNQNIDALISFLTDIAKIAPILYVYGNHEQKVRINRKWRKNTNQEYKKTIKNINNLHLLENESYTDKKNNINFYGLSPSYEYYEKYHESYISFIDEISKYKIKLSDNNYNVILSHSPINIYTFIKNNPNHELNKSDLILSGHMHNSGIPFFITRILNKLFHTTRGIISPNRTWFPKYSYGITKDIKNGFIYQGVDKFSKGTRLQCLNHLYRVKVHYINIKRAK